MLLAKNKKTLVPLHEVVQSRDINIDEATGVIHNVKVIGHTSTNGRVYERAALSRARGLYENINVNLDHARQGAARSVADRFGWLSNVREQADGLYADFNILKNHPQSGQVIEAAKRNPSLLGLSHNAEGRAVVRGGKTFVEEITRVRSVDLVSDPATVRSLFESEGQSVSKTLKDIFSGTRYAVLLEMDGMDPSLAVDAPADASADDQIKAAFRAAVMAAFDDDSLDSKATLAKIKAILNAQEKVMGGSEQKPAGEEKPKDESASEGRLDKIEKMLNQLIERDSKATIQEACKALCEAAHVEPSPILVETLALLPDEGKRKAFLETQPKCKAAGVSPRSGRPLGEAKNASKPLPTTAKEFLEQIRA